MSGLVSDENSLLGLHMTVSDYVLTRPFLCVSTEREGASSSTSPSSYKDTLSYGIKAPPIRFHLTFISFLQALSPHHTGVQGFFSIRIFGRTQFNPYQNCLQSISRSYYRFHKVVMFDFTFLRAVQTHFTLIDNLSLLKLFAKIGLCIIYYMI